jgi:hypothetical protein
MEISANSMYILKQLLKGQGDIRCGLDDRLLCVRVPSQYLLSRQDGGSEVIVFTGAARIKITGTLPCLNQALKSLHYMGMEDYNNNVPSLSPADKTGCPAETVLPPERGKHELGCDAFVFRHQSSTTPGYSLVLTRNSQSARVHFSCKPSGTVDVFALFWSKLK